GIRDFHVTGVQTCALPISLMDREDWPAASVLYIAPIRALLNNQAPRLERLTGLIGRRAFVWHGDTPQSARKRFLAEPADVLAIRSEERRVGTEGRPRTYRP